MANIFNKILGLVGDLYDRFGPVIDLFLKMDFTKLNDDDRVALGVFAAECKQAGAALIDVGNTVDAIKVGGISGEEYQLLAEKLIKAGNELKDLGPAAKDIF